MQEHWQLYNNQGQSLKDKGAVKDEVFSKGLLHGASHVWIWRADSAGAVIEILLQKRASNKRTWPNCYDISAAGHIDLGEDPITAALRETQEEVGLEVDQKDLKLIGVHRAHLVAQNGAIENEYQWLYTLQLRTNASFSLQKAEVASLEWKPFEAFKAEVVDLNTAYVPHGKLYFATVIAALEAESALK